MVRPIIISGPSGCGKSTILAKTLKEFPLMFASSVSHTTRKPRPGEIDGQHYYFTNEQAMKNMIKNNELFEYAQFSGNYYGTSKKTVENIQKCGKICILDVNLQGVESFKKSDIDAKYILIRPPSIDVLEKRLRNRGTETELAIAKRVETALQDLKIVESKPNLFDYVIVNDVLHIAYTEFIAAISDEIQEHKMRNEKQNGLSNNTNGIKNGDEKK